MDTLSKFACVRSNVCVAPMTGFHIGGTVRWFAEPCRMAELTSIVKTAKKDKTPFRVIGGGTNVLINDGDMKMLMIFTRRINFIEVDGSVIRVGAGFGLPELVRVAAKAGLSGVECLAGIPGTVGGAIMGNSGGKYGSIGDVVGSVKVLHDGKLGDIDGARIPFGYRHSGLGDAIIISAEIILESKNGGVFNRTKKILAERMLTQPTSAHSAGCVFKNVRVSDGRGESWVSAGALIDLAGLKGRKVGDAYVSRKHPNFIVNGGSATCKDVIRLIGQVRSVVESKFGVRLEEEIKIW